MKVQTSSRLRMTDFCLAYEALRQLVDLRLPHERPCSYFRETEKLAVNFSLRAYHVALRRKLTPGFGVVRVFSLFRVRKCPVITLLHNVVQWYELL